MTRKQEAYKPTHIAMLGDLIVLSQFGEKWGFGYEFLRRRAREEPGFPLPARTFPHFDIYLESDLLAYFIDVGRLDAYSVAQKEFARYNEDWVKTWTTSPATTA